jgi:uncharacterized membrane protein
MKTAILKAVILVLLCTIAQVANAGFFLCNETSQKLFVAVGYQEGGHWISRGWYSFTPTECNSLYLGVPENRNFYYFATSESWKSIWSGDNDADAGYFCPLAGGGYSDRMEGVTLGQRIGWWK